MSALGWILLALCVIALVAAAVVLFRRSRGAAGGSRGALRRRFGPEYDRTVEETGDRRTAERKLAEIARHRDQLDVHPLDPRAREGYLARWESLQARFVDDPGGTTQQADTLIAEVMRARGYPEATFDERAELISADRPEVVGEYRKAHARAASRVGESGTEELRSAFVHHRELFAWLVDGTGTAPGSRTRSRATAGRTSARLSAGPDGDAGTAGAHRPPAHEPHVRA